LLTGKLFPIQLVPRFKLGCNIYSQYTKEQNNILIRTFCVGFTPLLIPVTWLELTNIMLPLSMPKGIQRNTAVMPLMLYSQGKANGTSEKESWVGPKAGLDAVEK
jgi:hypothetical protein